MFRRTRALRCARQCVRLRESDNNREIVFVPPDGEFQLMSYRSSDVLHPPLKARRLCSN